MSDKSRMLWGRKNRPQETFQHEYKRRALEKLVTAFSMTALNFMSTTLPSPSTSATGNHPNVSRKYSFHARIQLPT
jgi:hypothetical protein